MEEYPKPELAPPATKAAAPATSHVSRPAVPTSADRRFPRQPTGDSYVSFCAILPAVCSVCIFLSLACRSGGST